MLKVYTNSHTTVIPTLSCSDDGKLIYSFRLGGLVLRTESSPMNWEKSLYGLTPHLHPKSSSQRKPLAKTSTTEKSTNSYMKTPQMKRNAILLTFTSLTYLMPYSLLPSHMLSTITTTSRTRTAIKSDSRAFPRTQSSRLEINMKPWAINSLRRHTLSAMKKMTLSSSLFYPTSLRWWRDQPVLRDMRTCSAWPTATKDAEKTTKTQTHHTRLLAEYCSKPNGKVAITSAITLLFPTDTLYPYHSLSINSTTTYNENRRTNKNIKKHRISSRRQFTSTNRSSNTLYDTSCRAYSFF